MKNLRILSLAALVPGAGVVPLEAQEALIDPGQKTVHMVRTATPPTIDGDLGDAAWEAASVVDDLHQLRPVEYAVPSEHTEIFILYDADALYVGVRLFDSDPALISAGNLRQNEGNIGSDDSFWVNIDPFNNRRSGYYFGLNPNGVRLDGLFRNTTEFYNPWDSIFEVAAGRFDGGWTAEFAIPFKSISLDPDTDTWGLNFSRYLVRRGEIMAWVSRNQLFDPSASGLAVGFEGLNQGRGLDVVTSFSTTGTRLMPVDPHSPNREHSAVNPALNMYYRLTPQLNAALTLNTDFSATEVDDRQVNLDRFNLFFPEKRDFFLREADIFEFGRIGGRRQSAIPGFDALSQNGRPFFSRRIGLSRTGSPVDIEGGGKISGRIGPVELGALSVRQDAAAGTEADTLSVVRARTGVLTESNIGFIVTEGSPNANASSSLAGVDFQYRNTRLPGSRNLEGDLWYMESDTDGTNGGQSAYGLGLRFPNAAGIRGGVEYKEYGSGFNPALGFVNRRGISDASGYIGYLYRKRGGFLQSWLVNLDVQHVDFLDEGALQTHALYFRPLEISTQSNDDLMIAYQELTERLITPFEISPGTVIPSGSYDIRNWRVQLNTGEHRRIAATLRVVHYGKGGFYDGDRRDAYFQLAWRPSPHFRGQFSYDLAEIDLPQGRFATRLLRMGLDVVFSPRLSWINLVQYDNVTEAIGLNSRLHWIPEAGKEFFLVLNHSMEDPERDNRFRSTQSDVTVKLNYTFRF